MINFPQITATTKGLDVAAVSESLIENGDDVVELQILRDSTESALSVLPLSPLKGGEVLTMASFLWFLMEVVRRSSWKASDHLLSVFLPQSLGRFRNALLGFFCVFVALLPFVAAGPTLASSGNLSSGFGAVSPLPERVPATLASLRPARSGAEFACTVRGDLGLVAKESSATDLAVEPQLSTHSENGSIANESNSGNIQYGHYTTKLDNPEPSLGGNTSEGATATGCGYGQSATPIIPTRAVRPKGMIWPDLHGNVQKVSLNDSPVTKMVTPQSNETSARFAPTGEAATITISEMEVARNSGKHAVLNILNVKIDDASDSLRDRMNTDFTATQPAAGSKAPNSISELIDVAPSADPPRTGAIGNIGNANTWWRNQATAGGAFSVADMNTMYNDCSDGIEFPHFLFTGQTPYEYYENSQVGLQRYQDTRVADAGFPTLQYKGSPMLWDQQIGITDAIYFINSDYLKICTYAAMDFKTYDFVTPDNQLAKTSKIAWMGNLESSNRRRLGVLSAITAPA